MAFKRPTQSVSEENGPLNKDIPFRIADFDNQNTQRYKFLKFPQAPPPIIPFWKRNPHIFFEYICLTALLVTGALMVKYSNKINWKTDIFGAIFFNAGFIPFITTLISLFKMRSNLISVLFNLQNVVLVVFLVLGLTLNQKPKDGWLVQIGQPIFEAGCIYWVYRALFFVEGPEKTVQKLETRVEELESSVAIGLADGMFWNFLFNVAQTIMNDYEGGKLPLQIKVEKNREDTYMSVLKTPALFIFVPSELDMNVSSVTFNQLVEFSKELTKLEAARGAVLLPKTSNYRPQFAKILSWEEGENDQAEQLVDGFFDIPTPLNVIFQNIASSVAKISERNTRAAKELKIFKSRLTWLIMKNGFDEIIKIVEIPNFQDTEFAIEAMKSALKDVQKEYTLKEEPHFKTNNRMRDLPFYE